MSDMKARAYERLDAYLAETDPNSEVAILERGFERERGELCDSTDKELDALREEHEKELTKLEEECDRLTERITELEDELDELKGAA